MHPGAGSSAALLGRVMSQRAETFVTFAVKEPAGDGRKLWFKLRRTHRMGLMFKEYAKRREYEAVETLRFLLDGEPIDPDHTPRMIHLGERDIVLCVPSSANATDNFDAAAAELPAQSDGEAGSANGSGGSGALPSSSDACDGAGGAGVVGSTTTKAVKSAAPPPSVEKLGGGGGGSGGSGGQGGRGGSHSGDADGESGDYTSDATSGDGLESDLDSRGGGSGGADPVSPVTLCNADATGSGVPGLNALGTTFSRFSRGIGPAGCAVFVTGLDVSVAQRELEEAFRPCVSPPRVLPTQRLSRLSGARAGRR